MRLNKKHKLYFRGSKGDIRNLENADPVLYLWVVNHFLKPDVGAAYNGLNKDVLLFNGGRTRSFARIMAHNGAVYDPLLKLIDMNIPLLLTIVAIIAFIICEWNNPDGFFLMFR